MTDEADMSGDATDRNGSGRVELPLEGVTVVSLEQAVAAPLATRHLADLGARVVKVERVATATSLATTTVLSSASPRTSCGSTAARSRSRWISRLRPESTR